MTADTIAFIVGLIALCISITSVFVARHYYHKTRRIEQSLKNREERPRYGKQ